MSLQRKDILCFRRALSTDILPFFKSELSCFDFRDYRNCSGTQEHLFYETLREEVVEIANGYKQIYSSNINIKPYRLAIEEPRSRSQKYTHLPFEGEVGVAYVAKLIAPLLVQNSSSFRIFFPRQMESLELRNGDVAVFPASFTHPFLIESETQDKFFSSFLASLHELDTLVPLAVNKNLSLEK
jgi:hypothetical protein